MSKASKKIKKSDVEIKEVDSNLDIRTLETTISNTLESDRKYFTAMFSKKYDICIKNEYGLTIKKLFVNKIHGGKYYTSMSFYNESVYHKEDDEDGEKEDDESDDELEEIGLKSRQPNQKREYSTENENLSVCLNGAFNHFFEKMKICVLCSEIHDDISETCNNCSIIKAFSKIELKECAICLETTKIYCTLPCNHNFHSRCVSQLKNPLKCPLCRENFELPLQRIN